MREGEDSDVSVPLALVSLFWNMRFWFVACVAEARGRGCPICCYVVRSLFFQVLGGFFFVLCTVKPSWAGRCTLLGKFVVLLNLAIGYGFLLTNVVLLSYLATRGGGLVRRM